MFFFNLSSNFVKTLLLTKINLATIQIIFPIIDHFERAISDGSTTFCSLLLSSQKAFWPQLHLNFSLSYTLSQKIGFALNSFYDISTMESLLESFSFFLLLINVFLYWFETAFHSKTERPQFASSMVKLSTFSLTFLLGTRWITSHHFPLSNLYESLIFLSWSLTVIHLILEKISHTLLIGVLLSPITLFINGFALFTLPEEMQKGNFLTPALQSNWLMMHVTVMISSYAALLSGSILAIAFLVITRGTVKNDGDAKMHFRTETTIKNYKSLPLSGIAFVEQNKPSLQSKENTLSLDSTPNGGGVTLQDTPFSGNKNIFLKNKKIESNFFSLNPFSGENVFLQEKGVSQNKTNLAKTLDNLSYRTIGIGFPLLTIGILSGAVWANEAWGSYWSWDPKETWALITWFLFAMYLHTRITKGLQGEKPAIIATVGFVVVWICFLGVNLASQGLHTYGWLQ